MAQVQRKSDALIEQFIELDPRRPRIDDARVEEYGIAVWEIVGRLEAAHGDVEAAAADYDLPPDAVRAALAYYKRYRDAIDARRAANRVDVA